MPLLSGMMRQAAITGNPDRIHAWCADRQGAAWAERTVRAAMPGPATRVPPQADAAGRLRALNDLHAGGVVTDAEFERLRSRLRL